MSKGRRWWSSRSSSSSSIALLYGIVSYGLILSAQSTVTQAAADGARAGIVATSTAKATAEAQAANDLGWMDKGTCYQPDAIPPVGTTASSSLV